MVPCLTSHPLSDSLAEQTEGLAMEVSGRPGWGSRWQIRAQGPSCLALPLCRQRQEAGCGSCYPGGLRGSGRLVPILRRDKVLETGSGKRLEMARGCGTKGWRWAEARGGSLLSSISGGGCPNTEQGPGDSQRQGPLVDGQEEALARCKGWAGLRLGN